LLHGLIRFAAGRYGGSNATLRGLAVASYVIEIAFAAAEVFVYKTNPLNYFVGAAAICTPCTRVPLGHHAADLTRAGSLCGMRARRLPLRRHHGAAGAAHAGLAQGQDGLRDDACIRVSRSCRSCLSARMYSKAPYMPPVNTQPVDMQPVAMHAVDM